MGTNLTDFLKIIYNENDYSRGFATSIAGIISLCLYIQFKDIIITLLVLIIFYPISRLFFIWIINNYNKREESKKITNFFQSSSFQEEILIKKFVNNGSSFLHYSYINEFQNELETLKNRDILNEVENGFQLNIKVFDKAKEIYKNETIPF